MRRHSKTIQGLIQEFSRLPGIGEKSAERMAFHVVDRPAEDAFRLADAIRAVKELLRPCARCNNLTEEELCAICSDAGRDPALICVVERPRDLQAIEATGRYAGTYHVLLGRLAPLDGLGPESMQTAGLIARLKEGKVREVILALDPDLEGDGTALYLRDLLLPFGVKATRLARGLPAGSSLEHANRAILTDALAGRREMEAPEP